MTRQASFDLDTCKQTSRQAEMKTSKLAQQLQNLVSQLSAGEAEVLILKSQIRALKGNETDRKKEMQRLGNAVADLEAEAGSVEAQLGQAVEETEAMRDQLDVATKERDAAQSDLDTLRGELLEVIRFSAAMAVKRKQHTEPKPTGTGGDASASEDGICPMDVDANGFYGTRTEVGKSEMKEASDDEGLVHSARRRRGTGGAMAASVGPKPSREHASQAAPTLGRGAGPCPKQEQENGVWVAEEAWVACEGKTLESMQDELNSARKSIKAAALKVRLHSF